MANTIISITLTDVQLAAIQKHCDDITDQRFNVDSGKMEPVKRFATPKAWFKQTVAAMLSGILASNPPEAIAVKRQRMKELQDEIDEASEITVSVEEK